MNWYKKTIKMYKPSLFLHFAKIEILDKNVKSKKSANIKKNMQAKIQPS